MSGTNNWHLKQIVSVGIIGTLFAMGVAWGTNNFRVGAVEMQLAKHNNLQMHPQAGERMIKLETHMGYVRKDVGDIKDIVKDLSRKFDRIQSSLPRIGPTINR